jgi:hypothetical protein
MEAGMMRAAVVAVVVLAGAGGLVLLLFYLGQERFVFFPGREVTETPEHIGRRWDDVSLRTDDGIVLAAWWVPVPHARGAAVLCHGNAGTIADRLGTIYVLGGLGLSVLAFDYRGYGASGGEPSEAGTARDVDAALRHLAVERGVALDRTVLYGESLGGAVAIEAAIRHRPAALVVESTFTSVGAMAAAHFPLLPGVLIRRVRYDSLARIASLRCPVLVLHAPDDSVVPYRMGRALFEAAPGPKAFADLEGNHNDGGILISPDAQVALGAFLDSHLPLSRLGTAR